MTKPKVKIGDEVRISFDDHAQGSDDIIEYFVYGRVAKITQRSVTVDAWAHRDHTKDRENDRDNITTFTVLKKAIKEIIVYA